MPIGAYRHIPFYHRLRAGVACDSAGVLFVGWTELAGVQTVGGHAVLLHIADDAGGVVCRWCIHRSDVGALLDDDGIHRKVGGAFKDGVRSADDGGYRTDNAGGNCKRAASGMETQRLQLFPQRCRLPLSTW